MHTGAAGGKRNRRVPKCAQQPTQSGPMPLGTIDRMTLRFDGAKCVFGTGNPPHCE